MHRKTRAALVLVLSLGALPAAAATLRCVAVNGNVTCAGEGAASCQTVDGHTVCTAGNGSVVQSFGGTAAPADDGQDGIDDPDVADDADMPPPPPKWHAPQRAGRFTDKLPATRHPATRHSGE